MGTHPIFESDFDCLTEMRFTAIIRGKKGGQQFDYRRVGKFNPHATSGATAKTMFADLYAQQSSPAPPLGPILSAKGITVMKFNEDFNNRSIQFQSGVPIRTRVNFEGGGKWTLQLGVPPLDFHILQAAGLDEKTHNINETVGSLTLRHVYEIARFHARDDWYIARDLDEKKIVKMIIHRCKGLGVQVGGVP